MSDAYRETLHRWAAQRIPEGATITQVEIDHHEGRAWSEVTYENGHLWVTIHYTLNGRTGSVLEDDDGAVRLLTDMGQLLTELFAIEETQP